MKKILIAISLVLVAAYLYRKRGSKIAKQAKQSVQDRSARFLVYLREVMSEEEIADFLRRMATKAQDELSEKKAKIRGVKQNLPAEVVQWVDELGKMRSEKKLKLSTHELIKQDLPTLMQ